MHDWVDARENSPPWFCDLAEVVGGYHLNEKGVAELLNDTRKAGANPPNLGGLRTSPVGPLGRWYLSDRSTRGISPYATLSVKAYAARLANLESAPGSGRRGGITQTTRRLRATGLVRGARQSRKQRCSTVKSQQSFAVLPPNQPNKSHERIQIPMPAVWAKSNWMSGCPESNSPAQVAVLLRVPPVPGKTADYRPETGKTWDTFVPPASKTPPKK